ncbi:uncharacterized protein TNCV_2694591 [Trichonephila clavipes]|nr:uncharacterized protein TNCV_2694591 [Trichonephila clavipes]
MDEQLKARLEGINALKNGQEETKQEMRKGQEETKERMERGQQEMQKEPVLASPVPVTAFTGPVKLSTYDGKTNGEEYAYEVEKFPNLAFSAHLATVREVISLKYFVDGLKDGEIQRAVRMADVQDLKSALLYAPKLEATTQASRRDHQSIQGSRVTLDSPCESPWKSYIEKLRDEFQAFKAQRQNQEKRKFKCWGCGGTGHLRRNCPLSMKDENTVSSSKQEN